MDLTEVVKYDASSPTRARDFDASLMADPIVFVIDNDPLIVSDLGSSLAQETGYEVYSFTSIEALDASPRRPDCVIAGHRSSGLDGLGLLSRLSRHDPEVVGLVMTRIADEEATAHALAVVGPLRHIAVPFSLVELLPKLEVWLDRRQLQQAVRASEAALATRSAALAESAREVERTSAELRTTHSELRTATERLVHAEQLAAVGRVATGIAYELTRQLALVGYAEAIKSRVADDPELIELADVIIAAQKRLAAMVDEIRDFAAAEGERDRVQIQREPADVAAVVDEAVAIVGYDRDVRQRTIERRYRARPLAALHHHKFCQVVINLLSNAVQATGPGGQITIELDIDEASEAVDGVDGPVAVLSVTDDGAGMSPEVLARLGEPFFTTRGDRGSGLGVGICMRIVEEHGGRLTYDSEVGRGTSARVSIPLLPEESDPSGGDRAAGEANG
ncbi:ATP-binding protein [Haliangium sp.]|uniref:two-component system sensor histidine kinase NtrB n=1 Tax=Haliangium sp. TaxID=2663208 RepID=UPI003D150497